MLLPGDGNVFFKRLELLFYQENGKLWYKCKNYDIIQGYLYLSAWNVGLISGDSLSSYGIWDIGIGVYVCPCRMQDNYKE